MKDQAQISIKLFSYRNAYYQGQTKAGRRHGYGMLIHDDGSILIASWKNDVLQGRAAAFLNC